MLSLLLALMAAPVEAETAPRWAHHPTAEETAFFYPRQALDRGIPGDALVRCRVRPDGQIEKCAIVRESPYGLGFGPAAVRLIEAKGRMIPRTRDGKPLRDDWVSIPVGFGVPEAKLAGSLVVRDPVWARVPTLADLQRVWPSSAGPADEGSAVLSCKMAPTGRLFACDVTETKGGQQFGPAAKKLAGKFQISPPKEVLAPNARVAVPVRLLNPATPAGRRLVVDDPRWIVGPNSARIAGVFPAAAKDAGIDEARVVADCLIAQNGALTDCRIERERPANLGFGAATLKLAGTLRMNPWTGDGRPAAGARYKLVVEY